MDVNSSSYTVTTHVGSTVDGLVSGEMEVVRPTMASMPITGIHDVSARVAALMADKITREFPRSADGSVRFTLFERCMPHEWLWRNDRVLPVLLSVGASWLSGPILSLEAADRDSLTGYRLRGEMSFSDEMVHGAFADAVWDEHEVFRSGKPTGQTGKHLELGRWSQDGLFHRMTAQNGLQPKGFVTHAQKLLPDHFYRNPAIAADSTS